MQTADAHQSSEPRSSAEKVAGCDQTFASVKIPNFLPDDLPRLLDHQPPEVARRVAALLLQYKCQAAFSHCVDMVGRERARRIVEEDAKDDPRKGGGEPKEGVKLGDIYSELFRGEAHMLLSITHSHSQLLQSLAAETVRGLQRPIAPSNAPIATAPKRPPPQASPREPAGPSPSAPRKRPVGVSPLPGTTDARAPNGEPRKRPPPNQPVRPPTKLARSSPTSASHFANHV